MPRKHHFVPKSFLASWTTTGALDGQLQVIDKSTGGTFSLKPVNAAKETDLYLVEIAEADEGVGPADIERMFDKVEGAVAPVVKRLVAGQDAIGGGDLLHLAEFMSTLALRVPVRLDWIDDFMRKPVELVHRRLDAEGKLPQPEDPELRASMKEWFDNGLIRITIKQNARLAMMLSAMPILSELLCLREWTVLRTKPDAGDLICTDNPVLLEWTIKPPIGQSPGYGLRNTAVFVPLGPSTAVLGLWDAKPEQRTLTRNQVEFWNGELLGRVHRFVFSRGDFAALHRDGSVDRRIDVARRWAIGLTRQGESVG